MSNIKSRKDQHLDIVLAGRAAAQGPQHPFDALRLPHEAAPNFALADVDLTTPFLGKTLRAPFLVSSMTGGPARATKINRVLADVAQSERIAFAVGSQRIAIEAAGDAGFERSLRTQLADVPLLANIGAAQVVEWKDPAKVLRAVDMLEADGLIVHFNPLQEALQEGGDTDWRGLHDALADLAAISPVPLIAKEVGSGISGTTAKTLVALGFQVIDVAGVGGTSWAAVEAERSEDPSHRTMAAPFHDWGIPTPDAIIDVAHQCPGVPVIASGGIRHGLDAAKAIRLGATLVGQAAQLLGPAMDGPDATRLALEQTIRQLQIACFCTGARSLDALRAAG